MKTNFKLAIAAICVTAFGSINAQQTTGDITKATDAQPSVLNGSVKVIDNKGTIKYLQSSNGITTLTNTTNDVTTTTWQLGGVITENTTLTLNDGVDDNIFVIDGVNYSLENIATTSGTSATATTAASNAANADEYTLLVRNEQTGNVEKLLATDLVSGIRTEYTQALNAVGNVPITVTGLPLLNAGTTDAKLFVYRNGAKLRSGTDFVATADTVTIQYSAADLPMYAGDIIEIQYIK